MVEYQNWYQVLKPIGSFHNERSRVEILKKADESDLRLREKVRSMPFGFNKTRSDDAINREPFVAVTLSEKSLFADGKSKTGDPKSYEDVIITKNLKKRPESETYLSPRLKEFQDQEKEIQSIFWNLLKTVDLKCPDDIDVDAIRNFLKKRDETLGRLETEETDLDLFDKYGLGINAQQLKGAEDDRRPHGPRVDSLMAMLDQMVEERTKPIPIGKDMYDKNNPITGKVGFRRDEMDGPREYTDLDEQLDFGDLDKDVDFKKFWVKKGKGRLDPHGNFIPFAGHMDKRKQGKEWEVKSGDLKKGRKKKAWKGGSDADSSTDESRRGVEDKPIKSKQRTASQVQKYLDDLKKARKYPDWDFPMCNYPKWVHRLYRMDQEKIGQLIKQGMDVPEYCPPWMTQVLDRVWDAKDGSTRGEKPSDLRGKTLKGRASTSGLATADGKEAKKTRGDDDKKLSQKGKYGRQSTEEEDLGIDRRVDVSGLEAGGSKTSFGMDDFLEGYEKEMLDLSKLENVSDIGGKRPVDDSFDIDDLIAEYEAQLQREEDILTGAEEKKKRQKAEIHRKVKERQEMAKKKKEENERKLSLRRDKQLDSDTEEKISKESEHKIWNRERKIVDGRTKSIPNVGKSTKTSKKSRKKRHFRPKKVIPVNQLCSEFASGPRNRTIDEECMRRFSVLLQGRNKVLPEDEFMEIAKQISLFKYKKAPPPKTPCERVAQQIC